MFFFFHSKPIYGDGNTVPTTGCWCRCEERKCIYIYGILVMGGVNRTPNNVMSVPYCFMWMNVCFGVRATTDSTSNKKNN